MEFKQSTTAPSVSILDNFMPEIVISKDALAKMQLYVEGCSDEIGWLGTAVRSNGYIYISDVFLFQQDVHSTTTEITPEGLAEFAEELLAQPDGMEIWNNIRVWGHSHVNMATTPSGQDNKQMETFAEGGHDWFIRIIANKRGDLSLDLYDYRLGLTYKNLKWYEELTSDERTIQNKIKELQDYLNNLYSTYTAKYKEPIESEIKNKVRTKTYGKGHVYTPADSGKSHLQAVTSYNGITTYQQVLNAGFAGTSLIDNVENIIIEQDDGYIKNDMDVWACVDRLILEEVAKCKSFTLAKTLLKSVDPQYTHEEMHIIWKTAKEYYTEVKR